MTFLFKFIHVSFLPKSLQVAALYCVNGHLIKGDKMNDVERLISRARIKECRIQIRFNPEDKGEEWEIKLYPEMNDDAHFYAYSSDINQAAKLVLDEVQEEFGSW
jgi:hypothetical protein